MTISNFKRSIALLAGAVFISVPAMSLAGYTVTTGTNSITNVDPGNNGATVGDSFFTTNAGTFSAFAADTPNDPQLTGADLPFYRYTLNGMVTAVGNNAAHYSGTYSIFYDLNLNGVSDENVFVSQGNFVLSAQFTAANTATLNGFLQQTSGPSNPAFADLSYGGFPVIYTGTYVGSTTNPLSATIQGTLRQTAAAVPEPASMAVLGLGAIGLIRRRRNRNRNK